MYLVGSPHPHQADAHRWLERVIADRERLVTDAEVLQEILHRYVAIQRKDSIGAAFEALLGLVDEVFAVEQATVQRARDLVLAHQNLSARDAIHAAVMQIQGVRRILTFDKGFDQLPGIERLGRTP